MHVVRRYLRPVLLIALVALLTVVVVRTALAGTDTAPRDVDRDIAARTEPTPGQQHDLTLRTPDGEWVGGLGLIEPARPESRLAPAVAGRIAAVHVEEGQRVAAGTLLVELESGPEQAALAAAEAEVAVAEATLVRSRRGVRAEDLEALTSDAQAASARAELSAGVLARLEAASRGGGVTVDELERARRQADADRLSALTASARQRAGQSGRREDVLVAHAQLQAAIARRDQARAALDRLRIVAPVDGEVLEVHFRVGEYAQPGGAEPLIVMGDTSRLRARIDVDERDVARVREGAAARISVDAFPDRFFDGRVVAIGRRMGRKNVRSDEPTERIDTKVLEVVVELGEDARELIVGQRAMGYLAPCE
ncbi:HlyD family secretion protein [Sandaracinus amylolyticus]|uniref:Putative membrane fusion protein MFP n=1 Tax=Sandaracinus amylolyticus TaxID=927083 RepID=A0A0F6W5I7_9BACT|nr:efflux RND transporter periplasmic adaptor subunit [Sandaracinus amylolyticus]AKF07852.1 Putative membrane fusion protein MFP [Sandaracinus amylolyticus]